LIERITKWLEARRRAADVEAAHVDVNQKCPWCGNRGVTLKAGFYQTDANPQLPLKPLVQVICKSCSGEWYEKTVADPKLFVKA
jgi:hypothetical protein